MISVTVVRVGYAVWPVIFMFEFLDGFLAVTG